MKRIKQFAFIITFFIMIASSNYINAQSQMNIKKQSLVTIAALEARGDLKNLEPALNQALDNGLSVNQVKEALSQLYAYTGFPARSMH